MCIQRVPIRIAKTPQTTRFRHLILTLYSLHPPLLFHSQPRHISIPHILIVLPFSQRLFPAIDQPLQSLVHLPLGDLLVASGVDLPEGLLHLYVSHWGFENRVEEIVKLFDSKEILVGS